MRNGPLEKLSLKELIALEAKVKAAIEEKRVSERAEMRAKMQEMARASGFSVAELFGGRKGKSGKGVAKYRNPKDPSQTWTGRGRRPTWREYREVLDQLGPGSIENEGVGPDADLGTLVTPTAREWHGKLRAAGG